MWVFNETTGCDRQEIFVARDIRPPSLSRTKDDQACRLSMMTMMMTVNGASSPTLRQPIYRTQEVGPTRRLLIFSPLAREERARPLFESGACFVPKEAALLREKVGSFLQDRMHIAVFSGTAYGDEIFPFEKKSRKVGQDAFRNIIDLERVLR